MIKPMDGWTSVYSAAMPLPPGLMRNLARSAGVHIWLKTDDALYTDGQFAGIHAARDGQKVLRLPARFRITDAVTGRDISADADSVKLEMKRAETMLLRLEPIQE